MKGRQHVNGFTLVEMLVVLTLLSLVMLGLAGAMRSVAQVETRVDMRLNRLDNFRIAVGFLRTTLERVSAKRLDGLQAGQNTLPFAGEPQSLIWVGVMPARYGAGGRHFFKLSAEDNSSGKRDLVIRFVPYAETPNLPDWSQAGSLVLASDLIHLGIRYQDARLPGMPWRSDWPYIDRLPAGVSLSIEASNQAWPDIMTPLYVIPGPGDGSNVFVTGGGSRQ